MRRSRRQDQLRRHKVRHRLTSKDVNAKDRQGCEAADQVLERLGHQGSSSTREDLRKAERVQLKHTTDRR